MNLSFGGLSLKYLVGLFVLFILYFLSGRFGLGLDSVGGFATLVWAPAGIALAFLYLFGLSLWPAVFLAAFFVNFQSGATVEVAMLIAVGNSCEVVFGAYLLKNIFSFNPTFGRLKDATYFLVTAAVAPAISSTVGTLSLFGGGLVRAELLWPTFLTWWVGDFLGMLIVSPLILVWLNQPRLSVRGIAPRQVIEALLLFGIVLFICSMSFGGLFGVDARKIPLTQLLYPMLIWISIRLNQKLAFSAIFLVAFVSIFGTINGRGPFIRGGLSENLFFLNSFIGNIALTFTFLISIMAERRTLQSLKDEFLSTASHELKTPITTIKAYVQLVRNRLKSNGNEMKISEVSSYVSRMDEQINRIIKLIYELLDVSRIESGKIELALSEFEVCELINETVTDLKRITKSHQISFDCANNLFIKADKFRISQVLVNLVSNAIKFSAKSTKIIIKVKKNRQWVTFSVQDFGDGIEPKYQNEIFERFFQTEQNRLQHTGGLGLGLYLSSEIVKKHGGRIWVESKTSKGSTFYFTLPRSRSGIK